MQHREFPMLLSEFPSQYRHKFSTSIRSRIWFYFSRRTRNLASLPDRKSNTAETGTSSFGGAMSHCGDNTPANPLNCNINQPFNAGCNPPFSGAQSHDIETLISAVRTRDAPLEIPTKEKPNLKVILPLPKSR